MNVLVSHCGYEEIDYASHSQSIRLRLFQILTRRSFKSPYRGLRKMQDVGDQRAFNDWNSFSRI
jgi:hypothetical protein